MFLVKGVTDRGGAKFTVGLPCHTRASTPLPLLGRPQSSRPQPLKPPATQAFISKDVFLTNFTTVQVFKI